MPQIPLRDCRGSWGCQGAPPHVSSLAVPTNGRGRSAQGCGVKHAFSYTPRVLHKLYMQTIRRPFVRFPTSGPPDPMPLVLLRPVTVRPLRVARPLRVESTSVSTSCAGTLVRRYNRPEPRCSSYPTVPHFPRDVAADVLAEELAAGPPATWRRSTGAAAPRATSPPSRSPT